MPNQDVIQQGIDSKKEQLLQKLEELSKVLSWDETTYFTAQRLGEAVGISRNMASQYLNEYVADGEVVKVNTRPVYFFHKAAMSERLHCYLSQSVYDSLEDLRQDLSLHPVVYTPFEQMVGASGSLRYCVEQCKAAMIYPDGGLPILIQGPTGTGKSVLAQLTYEYAVSKGILSVQSRFVTVNCSEYANNPELLLTNLFGHRRGAYTGADRDRKGLIALADGGVLFLDEVHCLKSECQEKLFLFMDKGIYHMVGDNENWFNSNVKMIFATTESPECVLLRTLLRRIPIVTNVPSLENRPLHDKKELVYHMMLGETQRTGRNLSISALAYQTVIGYVYTGNVGQLGNCLKASIANALVRSGNDNGGVCIFFSDLPVYLMSSENAVAQPAAHSDRTVIDLETLRNLSRAETRLVTLGNAALHLDKIYDSDNEHFWSDMQKKLAQYTDYLFFTEGVGKTAREEIILNVLTNIFNSIAKKYSIGCVSNNEILTTTRFLCDYQQNLGATESFSREHKTAIPELMEGLRKVRPIDYTISMDIGQLITHSLNLPLDGLGQLVLSYYVRSFGNDLSYSHTPGIILAHGYSTASSIAQATNHMLNGHIFEAIDMPIDSSPESVVIKLEEYLKRMNNYDEIVILVDMGSLEVVHKELTCPDHMNVGIINCVTTRMALHVGSMIQTAVPIREILEKASEANVSHYTLLENRKRENAILTVCSTGIGTAEKITKLIEDSLPRRVELVLMPYDYGSLRAMGRGSPVFEKYNVKLIAGTLDPCIDGVDFVSVEDIIAQRNETKLLEALEPYLTVEELEVFKHNIIRNFSLQNLLDYLTILNPEKIVVHVEQIIDELQRQLATVIRSSTKVGLYLHICCLIERLITDRHIVSFEGLTEFETEHDSFIAIVRDCFAAIERSYSVQIPISEIGYLYEYLYRDNSTVSTDAEIVSMFND